MGIPTIQRVSEGVPDPVFARAFTYCESAPPGGCVRLVEAAMDQWASELSRCLEHAPTNAHDIARVTHMLRAMADRPIGRRHRERCRELMVMVEAWAERAQRSADTASVLAEVAELLASQLEDITRAAELYTRALTLHPTDVSVAERASRQLMRLSAPDALASVLREHARTLDDMPWVDDAQRAAAWARLRAVTSARMGESAHEPAGSRAGDDTATRVYVPAEKRGAKSARPAAVPRPCTSYPSRSTFVLCCLIAAAFGGVIATGAGDGTYQGSLAEDGDLRLSKVRASEGLSSPLVAGSEGPLPRALAARPLTHSEQYERRPLALSVDRGSVRVSSRVLPRREVVRKLQRLLPRFQACVAMLRVRRLPLELNLSWAVRPSGRVVRARLRRSALPDRERDCITSVLAQSEFPSRPDGARVKAVLVGEQLPQAR